MVDAQNKNMTKFDEIGNISLVITSWTLKIIAVKLPGQTDILMYYLKELNKYFWSKIQFSFF